MMFDETKSEYSSFFVYTIFNIILLDLFCLNFVYKTSSHKIFKLQLTLFYYEANII